MALEKQTVVDQITVTENGAVMYREATRIVENGKELAKTYHRTCLPRGDNLTGQPANVQAIAQAAWTPEVIAAYRQAQAEAAQRMGA